MKGLLRAFLITFFALWLTAKAVAGFTYSGGYQILLLATLVLFLLNLFGRPLLRLFFLPLNFLTLGLFSWVINVGLLYLLTLIVPQIKIVPFQFPGFAYQGFAIPPIYFTYLYTLVLGAFIISFISNFLTWLSH